MNQFQVFFDGGSPAMQTPKGDWFEKRQYILEIKNKNSQVAAERFEPTEEGYFINDKLVNANEFRKQLATQMEAEGQDSTQIENVLKEFDLNLWQTY